MKKLSLSQKKSVSGWLFVSPFIIGFLLLFLKPMGQSVIYSFSNISFESYGLKTVFVGLQNYKDALFKDAEFVRTVVASISSIIYQVPLIIIFSLFIAIILVQKFKGRVIFRAIFFLPVIILNGVIISIINGDYLSNMILSGSTTSNMFNTVGIADIMYNMRFSEELIKFIVPLINNIFNLVWSSGVQILLFLAGLQSIPPSLYESAKVEGATAWESFWKITFPMVSPFIVMNVVYTIVDNFTNSTNPVVKMISIQTASFKMAYSAALNWLYLLVVFIIIVVVYLVVNKKIVYVAE